MDDLGSSRSVVRALLVSALFSILVAFGLVWLRDFLVPFFLSFPYLNGIIVGLGCLGFFLCFWELARLLREARSLRSSAESFSRGTETAQIEQLFVESHPGLVRDRCLRVLRTRGDGSCNPPEVAGLLADSDAELEESRGSLMRYLIAVMVLLGLIGTFWGLLVTVSGVKDVLAALQPERVDDPVAFIAQLKSSIGGMLGGLSTAFSTSLFGLGGSVALGFVEVQVRQARAGLLTDLDRFVAASLLPSISKPLEATAAEAPKGLEAIRITEKLWLDLINRLDAISERTRDLAEEMRKNRETSENTAQAIKDIFQAEDRLINKIISVGLSSLRVDAASPSSSRAGGQDRAKERE